jgi:hypothetical protein
MHSSGHHARSALACPSTPYLSCRAHSTPPYLPAPDGCLLPAEENRQELVERLIRRARAEPVPEIHPVHVAVAARLEALRHRFEGSISLREDGLQRGQPAWQQHQQHHHTGEEARMVPSAADGTAAGSAHELPLPPPLPQRPAQQAAPAAAAPSLLSPAAPPFPTPMVPREPREQPPPPQERQQPQQQQAHEQQAAQPLQQPQQHDSLHQPEQQEEDQQEQQQRRQVLSDHAAALQMQLMSAKDAAMQLLQGLSVDLPQAGAAPPLLPLPISLAGLGQEAQQELPLQLQLTPEATSEAAAAPADAAPGSPPASLEHTGSAGSPRVQPSQEPPPPLP